MTGKKIENGEKIDVELRTEDRNLILEEALLDTDTARLLRVAEARGDHLVVSMTLADLDHLLGHIAATANHTDSSRVERAMDEIYWRLKKIEDRYEEDQARP